MSFFKKKRGLHAISPSQKRDISPLLPQHGTIRPKKVRILLFYKKSMDFHFFLYKFTKEKLYIL